MDAYEYFEDSAGMTEFEKSEPFQIVLFEERNSEATQKQGEVKSYSARLQGGALFASSKSDHSISVEKLLWADGWDKTEDERRPGQEMTLVILKAVFTSRDPDTRIRYARLSLVFDKPKDQPDASEPRVEAWSPFNRTEFGNKSTVQRKETRSINTNATAGWSGSSVTAGGSREKEISWEQTHFDEGWSEEQFSKDFQQRNGISWMMKQNEFEDRGVERELWVATLISRSKDPYIVRFNVEVHTTSLQHYKDKVLNVFGILLV